MRFIFSFRNTVSTFCLAQKSARKVDSLKCGQFKNHNKSSNSNRKVPYMQFSVINNMNHRPIKKIRVKREHILPVDFRANIDAQNVQLPTSLNASLQKTNESARKSALTERGTTKTEHETNTFDGQFEHYRTRRPRKHPSGKSLGGFKTTSVSHYFHCQKLV